MFGIDNWVKNFFVEGVVNNLRKIFVDINKISIEVGAELGKSPESFNGQIYDLLKSLSENVVLPIAILLVTLIIVTNFCRSFLDERERQQPIKIFIFFVITSLVALILVRNSFEIINYIITTTQVVVQNALNLFNDENVNLAGDIETFANTLQNMSIGQIFGVFITLLITQIIIWFVRILSQIVILGRFIEIFLRISISPIPFATFFSKESNISNTSYNFVKSMFSVMIQAILIMVVIGIYRALLSSIATDIGTEEALSLFLIKILGINLTLIFMLFQTKRIVDSILNVH